VHQDADRVRCFGRRALVVGAAQLGLFGVLVGRLHYLQVQEGERLRLLAEDNRISQRLLVPPRGRILDRLGRPIAENVPIYRVRLVPEQAEDVEATLAALARVIPLPPERIAAVTAQAKAVRPFAAVSIRDDLTWDEVTQVAVHTPELPGVLLESGLVRTYPHGPMLAHVVGYVGPVSQVEQASADDPLLQVPEFRIGKNGVEKAHDAVLRGKAGLSRLEVNAVGREIRELDRRKTEPGVDIRLSLDLDLQAFCMERLAGETAAAAVVVEVDSGAVLALASVPSFDPGVFTEGLSHGDWALLRDDRLHPLVNRCIRGQYPPGSTFKMITALAALETGAATPTTRVSCPGYTSLGNAKFHCWREHGHGPISLVQALAQSCDVYFYEMARRAGIDAIAEMARRFGLGEPLGVDLPGERGGLVPTREWKRQAVGSSWQKGETLVCGIGQGYVLATPLQLAVMTARLCNGGRAVRPWFVQDAAAAPAALPEIGVDPEHLALVLEGMNEVVNGGRGTARSAALALPGVTMAGKTGTSQVRRITKAERASGAYKRKERPREERDHALFVCFAPVERPRYAISVVVEHGESGARTAGPIAKDIMTRALEIDPAGKAPLVGFTGTGAA
jgi:penicillin-binding protein 2